MHIFFVQLLFVGPSIEVDYGLKWKCGIHVIVCNACVK